MSSLICNNKFKLNLTHQYITISINMVSTATELGRRAESRRRERMSEGLDHHGEEDIGERGRWVGKGCRRRMRGCSRQKILIKEGFYFQGFVINVKIWWGIHVCIKVYPM